MADLASLRATVHGRVQGVFFRDFTRQHAARLGLTGYVRNLPDGSVEVVAEGEKRNLEIVLGHLRVGPPAADVERVDISWSEHAGKYVGFSVRH